MHALERVPLPFPWFIVIFAALGALWAFLSTWLKQSATGAWDAMDFRQGVVAVVVCVAILIYMRVLKRAELRTLTELRPVVPIPQERYDRLARRMIAPQPVAEAGILVLSVAVAVFLFVLPSDELPMLPRQNAFHWLALVFLSLFGCLAVWIVLTLIYCGLRSSLALRGLAHTPLIVNAFDQAALLPFGWLAALHSLSFVGIVLIPMALLGPPRAGGGFAVLLLSLASLALLFVPLWGVHRQIVRARERVLAAIAAELMETQRQLLAGSPADWNDAKLLYETADKLVALRKDVLGGPSWPFRDYGAVAWVVTALLLPSLLTVLSQVITRLVLPIFNQSP